MHHFHCCRHFALPLVFVFAVLLIFSASPCFATENKRGNNNTSLQAQICADAENESDTDGVSYRDVAAGYLGIPYRYGGTGKRGIDCSGLTRKFYLDFFGIALPHNSSAQSKLNILDKVPLDPDVFESTDLLFFQNKNKRINHVGIYLQDGKFLHALPKKGVVISNLNSPHWKKRLVASRRVKDTVLAKAHISSVGLGSSPYKNNEITMGYAADIGKNLHVDLETFYSAPLMVQNRALRRALGLYSIGPTRLTDLGSGQWQGVRAATQIQPVDWLRVTPSLGMFDGPAWVPGNDDIWRVYGIETVISPTASNWSVTLFMQSLLNDRYFEAYEDAMNTDIGVHFNYRISKTLGVSVMGNWEGSYLKNDTAADNLSQDSMSFNLDLSF